MTTSTVGVPGALRNFAVGQGAIGDLRPLLVQIAGLGVPTGYAVRALDSGAPELVVRMSHPDAAWALAELLALPDRAQVPSTAARPGQPLARHDEDAPRAWVQSYYGPFSPSLWVRVVAVASDDWWPELRRLTVGDGDTISALLGAVAL